MLLREETAEALRTIVTTPWLIGALFAFGMVGVAFEALRLTLLFRSQGIRLSFAEAFRVVALGVFFNAVVPGGTGGDVMKLWYLARDREGRRIEVATVLGVDRFVALFSVLCIVLALVVTDLELFRAHAVVQSIVIAAVLGWSVLLVAALVASSPRLIHARFVRATVEVLPFTDYTTRALEALHRFRSHGRAVLGALAVSALGHATLLTLFVVAGGVLVPEAPPTRVCLLALLGLIVNALPITPGGIGVGEAAFDELFRTAGYPTGSPLILAWRASTIPVFVLGGLLYATGVRRLPVPTAQPSDPS